MSDSTRQDPRYCMTSECLVESGETLVSDRALDVSSSGLRVRAVADLGIGAPVTVRLRIPGSGVWVEGEGEITRRIEGRRSGDPGRGYGIRLRRMSPLSRQLMRSAACWYPESARGRGARRDPSRRASSVSKAETRDEG